MASDQSTVDDVVFTIEPALVPAFETFEKGVLEWLAIEQAESGPLCGFWKLDET